MPIPSVLSYASAYLSLIVTIGVLLRDRHSFVHRVFAAGLFLFAVEELFRGLSYGAVLPTEAIYWQKRMVTATALLPGVWLAFSLTYARVASQAFLSRWKWVLLAIGVGPISFVAI